MSPEAAAGSLLSGIAGFRLVTADLPGLRRFYAEVLGFAAEGPERPIDPAEMVLLGLHGSGTRQVMRLGDQLLGIDRFEEAGRACPHTGDAASLWFQHLALVVTDMAEAYRRVSAMTPISSGGPQRLPASSGGVQAYKFRDPDGHPLELLQFPPGSGPPAWRGRSAIGGPIGLGIDHSAISVADVEGSLAFYRGLGLSPGERTLNHGPEQRRLDDLVGVEVDVVPLHPGRATPHLELLSYRTPRGAGGPALHANDVAATRIVWHGTAPALLRDPDGHLSQVLPSSNTG